MPLFRGTDSPDAQGLPSSWGAFAIVLLVVVFGYSLYAFVVWPKMDHGAAGEPRTLRILEDPAGRLSTQQAFEMTARTPPDQAFVTRLSEEPFWLLFEGPGPREALELPSRHLQSVECWAGEGLVPIGYATRRASIGRLHPSKAGFALRPAPTSVPTLCKASFKGPARISVLRWVPNALTASEATWRWQAGVVEGGILTLAAFVVIVGLINRHWRYLIFAAWLVANLRVTSILSGWDIAWFNHLLPVEQVHTWRKIAIAAYFALTGAMLSALFPGALERVGHRWLVRIVQWSAVPLLAAACVLEYSDFLPVMWVTAVVGVAGIGFLLYRIVAVTRSRPAMWFAAALATVLLALMVEVVGAAFGVKALMTAVNSVTAAMVSSLIAAMAIAEHLRRARAEHMDTYRASPIGLFTVDAQDAVVRGNDAFTQLVGMQGWPMGFAWNTLFPQETLADIRRRLQERPRAERDLVREMGESARVWYHITAIAGSDGLLECSLQDVTERKASDENLLWLATHDPLTQQLNRRGLDAAVQTAYEGVMAGKPASVAYLDLERFKLINDLYGHRTGDVVLREVAERVKEQVRGEHMLARIGGDEFVLVFPDTALEEARSRCLAAIQAMRVPFVVEDKILRVGVSIGLAEMSAGLPVADTLSAADSACRSAKENSGEHLVVYARDAAAYGDRQGELKILHRLDQDEFFGSLYLQYQPFLSLAHPFGSLNFEALLRMNDETGRPVNTGKMVAAAEKAGLMQRIDRWVLLSVLKFLDEYRERLANTHFTCVNISGVSLNDESFVDDAMAMLREFPRVCGRLCFEVTETVALHDLRNTRRWIERLKSLDAKVALDDFGAGYTSFAYLRELPADALKIDGAFVRDMTKHAASGSIVQAIVDLAHNLGMRTVAEWVEDTPTITALGMMRNDYAQGWGICKPVGASELLAAVSTGNLISEEARSAVVGLDKTGYQSFRSALEGNALQPAVGSSLP